MDESSTSGDQTFAQIRGAFYRAEPVDYFMTRLGQVLQHAENPNKLAADFKRGIRAQNLLLRIGDVSWSEVELQHHLIIEAISIAHHATETLLRLFLAHARSQEDAAIDIAATYRPSEFKDEVRSWIATDGHLDELREHYGLWIGGIGPAAPADQLAQRDREVPLLQDLARYWLDEAPLYNALKHGLAAVPSQAELVIGADTGAMSLTGPSIVYLVRSPIDKRHTQLSQRTQWIDLQQTFATALQAVFMIENLWGIAKYRYASAEMPKLKHTFTDLRLSSFRAKGHGTGHLDMWNVIVESK